MESEQAFAPGQGCSDIRSAFVGSVEWQYHPAALINKSSLGITGLRPTRMTSKHSQTLPRSRWLCPVAAHGAQTQKVADVLGQPIMHPDPR